MVMRLENLSKKLKCLRTADVYGRKTEKKFKKFKIKIEKPCNKLKKLTSKLKILQSKFRFRSLE